MEVDSFPNEYFSSYEDLEVHKLMLEDWPRTETYKNAILGNKSYFANKTVMDVGCGSGILSLFCAQAGARKVYAVEASNMSDLAKEIIKENHLEKIIEVIHCKVEDLVLPNDSKVDVIVSEWMGFYLLHEGMLDSVLVARDKFLKADGHLFPETAAIYVAPCSLPSLYCQWKNFHGVSLKAFGEHLRKKMQDKPQILNVKKEDLLANPEILCWINLKEDKVTDLDSFSIQHVAAITKSGLYQGICLWFDCIFPNVSNEGDENQIKLGTGPNDQITHWKQTVIVLPQEQEAEQDEPIAFKLDMNRDLNDSRRYSLEVTLLDPNTVEHPTPCSCHLTKCILIKTFILQNAHGANGVGFEDESSDG